PAISGDIASAMANEEVEEEEPWADPVKQFQVTASTQPGVSVYSSNSAWVPDAESAESPRERRRVEPGSSLTSLSETPLRTKPGESMSVPLTPRSTPSPASKSGGGLASVDELFPEVRSPGGSEVSDTTSIALEKMSKEITSSLKSVVLISAAIESQAAEGRAEGRSRPSLLGQNMAFDLLADAYQAVRSPPSTARSLAASQEAPIELRLEEVQAAAAALVAASVAAACQAELGDGDVRNLESRESDARERQGLEATAERTAAAATSGARTDVQKEAEEAPPHADEIEEVRNLESRESDARERQGLEATAERTAAAATSGARTDVQKEEEEVPTHADEIEEVAPAVPSEPKCEETTPLAKARLERKESMLSVPSPRRQEEFMASNEALPGMVDELEVEPKVVPFGIMVTDSESRKSVVLLEPPILDVPPPRDSGSDTDSNEVDMMPMIKDTVEDAVWAAFSRDKDASLIDASEAESRVTDASKVKSQEEVPEALTSLTQPFSELLRSDGMRPDSRQCDEERENRPRSRRGSDSTISPELAWEEDERTMEQLTLQKSLLEALAMEVAEAETAEQPDVGEKLAQEVLDSAVQELEASERRYGSNVFTATEVDSLQENADKPPSGPASEAPTVSPELALEEDDQRVEQLTLQKSLADALALAEVDRETTPRDLASRETAQRDVATPEMEDTLAHELLDTAVHNIELEAARDSSNVLSPEVSAASQAEVDALRENAEPPSRPVSEAPTVSPELALEEDDQRLEQLSLQKSLADALALAEAEAMTDGDVLVHELLEEAVQNAELDSREVSRGISTVFTPTEVSVAASQAEVDALEENADKPASRPASDAPTVSPELALEEDDQRVEQLTLQKSLADALALAEVADSEIPREIASRETAVRDVSTPEMEEALAHDLFGVALKNLELEAARDSSVVFSAEVSVAASQAEVDALRENADKPSSRPVSEAPTVSPELALEEDDQRLEQLTLQRSLADALAIAEVAEVAQKETTPRDVATPEGETLAHELLDAAVRNVELDANEVAREGSAVLTPTEVSVAASRAEVDALRENADKPSSRPVSEAPTVSPELAMEEDDQRLEQLTLQRSLADALAIAEVAEVAQKETTPRDVATPEGETLAHELLDAAVRNVELDANEVAREGSAVLTPTEVSVAASRAEVAQEREIASRETARDVVTPDVGETLAHELLDAAVTKAKLDAE
ncbi:unnamed protein product, partial [Effrenium voratum]